MERFCSDCDNFAGFKEVTQEDEQAFMCLECGSIFDHAEFDELEGEEDGK